MKTEFRSAWVATVWALDWPTVGASAQQQMAEMDRMLDSLASNNFNAVNFQVRSMCDAMNKSSYEPWSSYLTGNRGEDPGYDPLQYVVDGCHRRGMECHAWVNPYRFSTGSNWTTPIDEELKASGHLLSYTNSGGSTTTILDPAQQWTIDRIVNVCRELVTNYDLDGILYDDYFYPNGIPSNSNAGDYEEWKNSGTKLSIGDWRRDNVNRMVKAVYDMIQTVKPWVRYGISPAGVACSSSTVAKKYGIDPCPGSDWQYNGIFSDPIAWYNDKSVDYISPQVYWTIGYSAADYGKITPWWGKVAQKFGRHVYISHSISSLTGASKGDHAPTLNASGPNSTSYDEYVNEVEMNRSTNYQDAPGSIYYSCKYLYALGAKESFAHYLKRTVYAHPALPPAMPWKVASNPGTVSGVSKVAYDLTWSGFDNVRYTVYAVPESVPQEQFTKQVEYLLGITYEPHFAIPEAYRTGYQYAICVLDRYGNEYTAKFLGSQDATLPAPTLIAPADGEMVTDPFEYTWHSVEGAQQYTVEVADDALFKHITHTFATADTTLLSTLMEGVTSDVKHYWRVHACALNYNDGISEGRAFTPHRLEVIYPAHNQQDVPNDPVIRWTNTGGDEVLVEISTDEEFAPASIVFSGASTTNALQIPLYTLHSGTRYYARVTLKGKTSPAVMFTTVYRESVAPTIVSPARDGETLNSRQRIVLEPQLAAENMIIEISSSATSWGRNRFVETLKNYQHATTLTLGELKVNNALLADGTTYYVRTKSSYIDTGGTLRATDYGTVRSFVYKKVAALGDVNEDGEVNVSDVTALINRILGTAEYPDEACDINADGVVNVSDVTALINLILG
ncbi:MAG: family 10 glycosylhydrolase [Bacteroidales bacterium]|nr:family 10 glycosylhydrolase [Bacteroidales bacterium]